MQVRKELADNENFATLAPSLLKYEQSVGQNMAMAAICFSRQVGFFLPVVRTLDFSAANRFTPVKAQALGEIMQKNGHVQFALQTNWMYAPNFWEQTEDIPDTIEMLLGVELDNQEKLREINELLRAAEEGRVVVTSSRKKAKRLETLAKADSKGQCKLAPVKIGGVVYIVGPKLISCGERGTIRTLPKEKEVYSGIVTAIKFSNTEPTIVEVIETRTPVNHGVVSQCQRCCEYELGITCFASENEAKTHL